MHIPDYVANVLSVLVMIVVSVSIVRGCSAVYESGKALRVERALQQPQE